MAFSSPKLIYLSGKNGQSIPCQRFSFSGLGLNARYTFTVEGVTTKPLHMREFQQATLSFFIDHKPYVLHGALLSLKQTVSHTPQSHFIFEFGNALHQLNNVAHQRLFIDMMPGEMIQNLLSEYKISAQFQIQKAWHRIPYTAQGGVSDYDFLLRICADYGLFFYFRHDESGVQLHITDEHICANEYRLPFNPNNGMNDNQAVITALTYKTMKLAQDVCLRGASEDNPALVWRSQTTNKTETPGNGTLRLSHPFVVYTESDCTRHAVLLQQQLDNQREWLQVEVAGLMLQAGDCIQLQGHPVKRANGFFRVLQASGSLNTSADAYPFRQQVWLTPLQYPYRFPSWLTQHDWDEQTPGTRPLGWQQPYELPTPALQVALTQGRPDGVNIDEQGRYYVQPLFDNQVRALGQSSHPVRQLQPSVGPRTQSAQGMHFPLKANTRVILAHLHHLVDKPIILGVLPGRDQQSAVTDDNRTHLTIAHIGGSALDFYEEYEDQQLSLHTKKEAHGLILARKQEQEYIKGLSLGQMQFNSKQAMTLASGHTLTMQSADFHFKSRDALILSAQHSMQWNVQNEIHYQAKNDWQSETSEGDFNSATEKTFLAEALDVSMTANDVHLQSASYSEAYAGNTLRIKGKTLAFKTGSSMLDLSKAQIKLNAAQLDLTSTQIIKNTS